MYIPEGRVDKNYAGDIEVGRKRRLRAVRTISILNYEQGCMLVM
jgi:hypothetical protein